MGGRGGGKEEMGGEVDREGGGEVGEKERDGRKRRRNKRRKN